MNAGPAVAAPAALEHLNAAAVSPLLLVCDHASKALPPAYGTLGISEAELSRHIGWDIGAAALTRRLAADLKTPALLAPWSRLLIDLNRAADDPTLICMVSDGTVIPANRGVSDEERARRVAQLHRPYHACIAAEMDRLQRSVAAPALVNIHSFTPVMKGRARPWHVGVLWNLDGRLARPLLDLLNAEGDLVVGDNEPYSGRSNVGFTMREHGARRGVPHILIEVRQDLIADDAGVAAWAARLGRILARIVAEHGPFAVQHFE